LRPHKLESLVQDAESWKRLVDARQPIYDRLAGLTIDTSTQPLDRVAEQIVEWLGQGEKA